MNGPLGQKSAHLFCEEPGRKSFQPVGPLVSAATAQLCLRSGKAATVDN